MFCIKECRQKAGITQEQLAEKLGVGQSTVAMWENGKNSPQSDKLPKLAEALGCTVNDLFNTK